MKNTSATREFNRTKAIFDTLIAELTAASKENFGVKEEDIHWGHVGDMNHRIEQVRDLADAYLRRGEYTR